MSSRLSIASLAALLAVAQGAEYHPPLPSWKCTTSGGCVQQNTTVVLDEASKYVSNTPGSRTAADYTSMGVAVNGDAVTLTHYVNGNAASPRIYLLDANNEYVEMSLLNAELTVTVDYSAAPCGENGAFYLSAMQANGTGAGNAGDGAQGGYGYCDAQGANGYPCPEMDVLEANEEATAMTPHPCSGTNCDKSGCGLNPYASGNQNLWGPGKTVDTSQPFTVVTAFHATSGTLSSIVRTYIQNGKTTAGGTISSCNDGTGGLSGMGQSLGAGMVLCMSIWNDPSQDMSWLDSGSDGPCTSGQGSPSQIESQYPNTHVVFSNIRWGDIGSTTSS